MKVHGDAQVNVALKAMKDEFDRLHAKFRTVSVSHIPEIKDEITGWTKQGMIQPAFYDENYGLFKFDSTQIPPEARSLIIIAIPQGITTLDFRLHGQSHLTMIPPTYPYSRLRATCQEILTRIFSSSRNTVVKAGVPFKLLTVRSGLGRYGKNNICYVEGMGSFHRLEAFYTDFPGLPDAWQPKEALEQCTACTRCMQACPTQAITNDRFLIHADRCLTYFNENEWDFPHWIPPHAHNALVGCLRCQFACPLNHAYVKPRGDTVVFIEEETRAILEKTPWEKLETSLADKIRQLDMDGYYSLLARNLAVLISG